MSKKDWVMASFKVGDVIRHVEPFWGEAAHVIDHESSLGFVCSSTGSIFGPSVINTSRGLKRRVTVIYWSEFESDVCSGYNYIKCPRYMMLWLWLVGQTAGRFNLWLDTRKRGNK